MKNDKNDVFGRKNDNNFFDKNYKASCKLKRDEVAKN
jgi:hypothetical protein